MAELKTQKNKASVTEFVNRVDNEKKREDSQVLLKLFKKVTGKNPAMWGDSIIGYDSYHYESERSKQKGDWPMTGFSPRKQNISIYIMPGFSQHKALLAKLGKHKTSVSCLYINKLADVDLGILEKIVAAGYAEMKKQYPK